MLNGMIAGNTFTVEAQSGRVINDHPGKQESRRTLVDDDLIIDFEFDIM